MRILYYKPTCPFCRRVVAVIERLQLEDVELRDIVENEAFAVELLERGGKRQVPYLVDEEAGVAMYESDDIVAYLQKASGATPAAARPRVHVSSAVCEACEG